MFNMDIDGGRPWRTAEAINSAMLRVYNYMILAVLTSGLVAMAVDAIFVHRRYAICGHVCTTCGCNRHWNCTER